MTDILGITGPIYILMALGYATTRWGVFARSDMRVLGRFVVMVALPALLFNALSRRPVAEIFNASFLMAFAVGSLAVMAMGMVWARRVRRKSLSASAYVGMGMACPNSGFIGFPLVLQVVGPVAAVGLALVMIVENFLLLPLVLAVADADTPQGGRVWQTALRSLRGLAFNPMIWGIVAGFLFAWFGWHLPAPVARTVDLLAGACGALALFVIGGSLSGLKVDGLWADVLAIAWGKLLLHPLAVLAMVALLPPMPAELRTAVVVFAAVPMLGIYPILAQRHGHDHMAAAAQLGTTVASFFTLTSLLWGLKHWA